MKKWEVLLKISRQECIWQNPNIQVPHHCMYLSRPFGDEEIWDKTSFHPIEQEVKIRSGGGSARSQLQYYLQAFWTLPL